MRGNAEERAEERIGTRRVVRSFAVGVAAVTAMAGAAAVPTAPATAAPAPTLRVGHAVVVESSAGRQAVSVPVSMSAPVDHDVHVMVVTDDLDATAGADYRPMTTPTRVRIRAGATTAHARVMVYGDQLHEPDERFVVRVEATDDPSVLPGASGTVTLASASSPSDPVDVQIGSVVVDEPPVGRSAARLPITLSRPLDHDATVRIETVDESARAGADHRRVSKDVRLRAGRVGATVAVPVFGDAEREGDERFSVMLTGTSSDVALGTRARGAVTIRDDEPAAPPPAVTGHAQLVGPDDPGLVALEWTASGGIDPASKYVVEVRRDEEGWQEATTTTALTVTHDCGRYARTCTYRVTPMGAGGRGPTTEIGTVTTQELSVPGRPNDVVADLVGAIAPGEVEVRWAPPLGGGPADGYRVERQRPDGSWEALGTLAGTRLRHSCGVPAVTCTYRVLATNAAGDGEPASATVRTQGVPAAPGGVTAEVWADRAVTVAWAAGTPDGGVPILRHRIRRTADLDADGRARSDATWTSSTVAATATSAIVGCPGPATGIARCRIEVRAENAVGDGPWSNGVVVLTVVVAPPPKGGGGPASPG